MKRLGTDSKFGLSSSVATLFAALVFGLASCEAESGDKPGGSANKTNTGKTETPTEPMDDVRIGETGGATPEEEAAGGGKQVTSNLSRDQQYDGLGDGTFLSLRYDRASEAFEGVIKNTTETLLKNVSVTVRLSTDKELGPTKPQNLLPGEEIRINLPAKGEKFDWWNPLTHRSPN